MVKPTKNKTRKKVSKKKSLKPASSHSRRKKEPWHIGQLIYRANKLDVDLPTMEELRHRAIRDGDNLIQLAKEQIEKMPNELAEWASEYLKPSAPGRVWQEFVPFSRDGWQLKDPFERYEYLVSGKRFLLALVRRSLSLREQFDLSYPQRMMVDIDGNYVPRPSLLSVALAEANETYVRECKVCKNIFWAGSKNQWGCSQPCAKKLQNDRAHKKYREKCDLERKRLANKKQSKKGK